MVTGKWRVWGVVVGATLAAAGLVALAWSQHAKSGKQEEVPKPGFPPISASQLYNAYAENGPSATDTYTGRVVDVSGICERSAEGSSGGGSVYLTEGTTRVRCDFDEGRRAEVRALRRGRGLTVRGICQGPANGLVILSGCRLVSDEPVDLNPPREERGFDYGR